jgi:hypothetical protein
VAQQLLALHCHAVVAIQQLISGLPQAQAEQQLVVI